MPSPSIIDTSPKAWRRGSLLVMARDPITRCTCDPSRSRTTVTGAASGGATGVGGTMAPSFGWASQPDFSSASSSRSCSTLPAAATTMSPGL